MRYLIVPRILAMVIMLFLLTVMGDLVAILGAMLFGKLMLQRNNILLPVWPCMFTITRCIHTYIISNQFNGLSGYRPRGHKPNTYCNNPSHIRSLLYHITLSTEH